jgi:hypothetical protein
MTHSTPSGSGHPKDEAPAALDTPLKRLYDFFPKTYLEPAAGLVLAVIE